MIKQYRQSKNRKILTKGGSYEIWVKFYRNIKIDTPSHYAFTSQIAENGKVKGSVVFFVVGDVKEKEWDPFITLKVADSVEEGQKYISGTIHITAYK